MRLVSSKLRMGITLLSKVWASVGGVIDIAGSHVETIASLYSRRVDIVTITAHRSFAVA